MSHSLDGLERNLGFVDMSEAGAHNNGAANKKIASNYLGNNSPVMSIIKLS